MFSCWYTLFEEHICYVLLYWRVQRIHAVQLTAVHLRSGVRHSGAAYQEPGGRAGAAPVLTATEDGAPRPH